MSKNIMVYRLVTLAAATALIIAGIMQQGQWDVMNKAIRICFECIGIG